MRLSDLVPAYTDRALIVGQTGSGKTVLAEKLLTFRRNVVVIDPKRRITWKDYTLVTTLRGLAQSKQPKIIYRPSHTALKEWQDENGDREIERAFEFVYLRGNTTLYVDETYLVTSGDNLPKYYHACLTQGRELGIETWSATQRPMNIPQVVMSEAEHLYAFRLRMPQDRRKVESMCAIDGDMFGTRLRKHFFYYTSQELDAPLGPLKLSL